MNVNTTEKKKLSVEEIFKKSNTFDCWWLFLDSVSPSSNNYKTRRLQVTVCSWADWRKKAHTQTLHWKMFSYQGGESRAGAPFTSPCQRCLDFFFLVVCGTKLSPLSLFTWPWRIHFMSLFTLNDNNNYIG